MPRDIRRLLEGKWEDGTRPKDLYARHIAKRPQDYVEAIVGGLDAPSRRVRGGCAELASLLSADQPRLLYPHVDRFLTNLAAKEPILRWEAACTVGNLAAADAKDKIPGHVAELVALLGHESIVLQGHAARALAKIAKVRPERAAEILEALFENARHFPGARVGYVVEAAGSFTEGPAVRRRAAELVGPYAESSIRPVAAKARKALRALKA